MKLIKLQDKFILVSDEKLKDGDWFYNTFSDNQPLIQQRKGDWTTCFNQQKIIAGIPEKPICTCSESEANYCNNGGAGKCNYPYPSIDFSQLSEEDCKKIGFIDVEKLAKLHKVNISSTWSKDSFIEGFKTAQSLNDKCFSLEDIENLVKHITNNYKINSWVNELYSTGEHKNSKEIVNDYLKQSIQQTEWDVEVEMELIQSIKRGVGKYNHPERYTWKPKITNNSIKITKIL